MESQVPVLNMSWSGWFCGYIATIFIPIDDATSNDMER